MAHVVMAVANAGLCLRAIPNPKVAQTKLYTRLPACLPALTCLTCLLSSEKKKQRVVVIGVQPNL